jgi:hypothetical protein
VIVGGAVETGADWLGPPPFPFPFPFPGTFLPFPATLPPGKTKTMTTARERSAEGARRIRRRQLEALGLWLLAVWESDIAASSVLARRFAVV